MENIKLWNGPNEINVTLSDINEIIKICNINDHIYVLSSNHKLYHGIIENQTLDLLPTDIKATDIAGNSEYLFIIEIDGTVTKLTKSLEFHEKVHFKNGNKNIKIKQLSIGEFGCLFVTDKGQLWAQGHMPQLQIMSTTEPKRVTFFNCRYVQDAVIGSNFGAALIRKYTQISFEESLSDTSSDDIFTNCKSSSTANSSSSLTDSADSSYKPASETVCDEAKKNFEVGKFLTRQLSWMSTVGEEYLVECTERPTRLIKENVSNVANLVYEGVKKTVEETFSRHVGSVEETNLEENESGLTNSMLGWSFSSLSDTTDRRVVGRSELITKTGSMLINTEVWTWGSTEFGQLGLSDQINRSTPTLVPKLSSIGVQKLSCGKYHCGALTLDGRVFLWGRNNHKQVYIDSNDNQSSPKLFRPTERFVDIACGDTHTCAVQSHKLFVIGNKTEIEVENGGRVLATGSLTSLNPLTFQISTKLSIEQEYLESMLRLQKNNEPLCKSFAEIQYFTAANVLSLSEFQQGRIIEADVIMSCNVSEHISIYKNYLKSYCDVIVAGGFGNISKLVDLPVKQVESIFEEPLIKIHGYVEINSKWLQFIETKDKQLQEALDTKQFWESSSGKVLESLRTPERRVLRESRLNPLFYSRFSNHWFVLFSDLFVHVNGTSQSIYPLPLIWVEPSTDLALSFTTPEDQFTLYTSTPQQKIEWLQKLQTAIKSNLKKPSQPSQAPLLRHATYTFLKHQSYKDAKYIGRWCNGKMHGPGKLEWPDGKIYFGQFQNNMMNGCGRIDIPNVGIYEGGVKDNLQNGRGVMKYVGGDIYEGYFKDGVRHGHGVMRQGNFMSNTASIYIGEWVCGVKQGYGVMDNISSGEKYLGNWYNNKKQDCGLIVTLDGIYYEGVFSQDNLTGHGVMIFEDNTHYEGEFKATGILNGKGTLTLSSGDTIEGTLHGTWNEGIKISNGILHMAPTTKSSKPVSFGKLSVPPAQKWKSIFKQCYQMLNVSENAVMEPNITSKIWQSVAVLITKSKQNGRKQIIDNLDTIPCFGRENLTKESFNEIRKYLFKAFESEHHPLGLLLLELTAAYNATYGGVRVHPLLLNHAVAELHSITGRIHQIVRLLFPALPPLGQEIIFDPDEIDSEVVNAAMLLHTFLLPRIHSALFVLYSLHHKVEDDAYWKRLLKWNKQPDNTLMAFLGIDQKFWPNSGEVTSPLRDQVYVQAIEGLQQLKTTFSPLEKLYVLRDTFQKMNTAVQTELGKSYFFTMDELFPIFHFIVVRARILQLGSEIHFMEDFMEPNLQNGELGIMFTILKACYYQILQEKINI